MISFLNYGRIISAEEISDEHQLFDNIEQTDEGFLITHEDMILLANYIEDLHLENERLQSQLDEYKLQLETERDLASRIIDSKDETIDLLERQITEYQTITEIQEEQIDKYEDIIDEYKSISEKHMERIIELERSNWRRDIRSGLIGSGITSTVLLIAIALAVL